MLNPTPDPHAERLFAVAEKLGVSFRNPALLKQALSHASYMGGSLGSNERLEFLGDAILGLIVCEHLYECYPRLREGKLTEIKSLVVSGKTLAQASRELGLEEELYVGRGVSRQAGLPESILADVFEAIVAALYLDQGLRTASDFVLRALAPAFEDARRLMESSNAKSRLQELLQKAGRKTPEYRVDGEEGPEHAKTFTVSAYLDGQCFGSGSGPNKKAAEQAAAAEALKTLQEASSEGGSGAEEDQ